MDSGDAVIYADQANAVAGNDAGILAVLDNTLVTVADFDSNDFSGIGAVTVVHVGGIDGSAAGKQVLVGTAGVDEFLADAAAGNRASADVITGFTDGSDTVRLDGIDDVYVETELSNGQTNVIIRSTNDNTATDNIVAVILDFDAAGTFDQNDLDAGTTFNVL